MSLKPSHQLSNQFRSVIEIPEVNPPAKSGQPISADGLVTKSGKAAGKTKEPEPPKTRAQALFQGQSHPKKRKKIVRMEQWVEVRIRDGQTVTRLYPSNDELIKCGQRMLPPPEFVYRRINFPDGIPPEYNWAGPKNEIHRERGGCGIQRMSVDTWLNVIDREKSREDGHIGPTGVGNLPRPQEHGPCACPTCTRNQAILDSREASSS
jgi:hypothetical protein